jgi:hypothetical protein
MNRGSHDRIRVAIAAAGKTCVVYYPLILYVLMFLLVTVTYRDFGVGFDEQFQARNGMLNLNYLLYGDQAYKTYENLRYYGPLFDVINAALWFPLWVSDPKRFYLLKHLLTALCGLLCAIVVHRAAQLMLDRPASWVPAVAGATVLLMPRFFGDMFHNPKDIPFACTFIWAVVSCLRCLRSGSMKHFVIAGFAVGLCIDVRIGGILLVPAFLAPVLWELFRARSAQRFDEAKRTATQIKGFIASCLLAVYVFWPYLWRSPFDRFYKALRTMSRFGWPHFVLFEGKEIVSQDLPWYYLGKWLLISLPEWIVVCAILGLGTCCLNSRTVHKLSFAFVALAFGIPFVMLSLPGRTIYDGVRHFFFGHTLIAIFAAIGMNTALSTWRRIARPLALMMVILIGVNIYDLIVYHPYQSIYFNRVLAVSRPRRADMKPTIGLCPTARRLNG